MEYIHLHFLLKKSLRALVFAAFFIPSLAGQDFIPYDMKYSQKEWEYYASKRIVTEKITRYSTGKNFIPDGKPVDRKIFSCSPDGRLVSAVTIDSTGERVDSFFYYAKGNFRRITSHTRSAKGFIPTQTLQFINQSGKSPSEVLVFTHHSADGLPTTTYLYDYSEDKMKVKILTLNLADSSVSDTSYIEFDNSGRKTKKWNRKESTEFKYDAAGNMIEKKVVTKAGTVSTKYTLNNSGRPIKTTESSPGQTSTSELLYNMNGILILTKTRIDSGKNQPEKFEVEIREISY